MRMRTFVGFLLILFSSPLNAYWFGDPSHVVDDGQSSFQAIHDFGEKDLVTDAGNTRVNVEFRKTYLQYAYGLGGDSAFFVRGMPTTGRLNFERSGLNPHLSGLGGGLQWSPQSALRAFRFGMEISGDWAYGSQDRTGGRDKVTWFRGAGAAGVSLALSEDTGLYGGFSYIIDSIRQDESGAEIDYDQEKQGGSYWGIEHMGENWILGAEFHMLNERALGFTLGHRF